MSCYKCRLKVTGDSWYGLHPDCFKQWFNVSSLEQFQNIASQRMSSDPLEERSVNSSFFHGKFRKYSASLLESRYILKVEESDYPELPVSEYLCNQIFSYLNINVPPFYLIRFEKEHSCFVTRNFMSSFQGANLIHIYHFIQKDYDCESLLQIIREKTGRLGDMEAFINLTLADSLIGNNDRHGRNLGLIQTSKGYIFSPIYDNPSYLGTEINTLLGADHHPLGAVSTSSVVNPSMRDYVHEWEKLGFGPVVEKFRKKISLVVIEALIKASFLSAKRQEAFFRLISKRYKELCQ